MDSRTNAQRDAYVRYESLVHPERLVCVVALALVSLIEVPLWCLQGRNNLFWVGGSEVCRKHDLYLSGIEYALYIATLLVEACALGYLATLCGLEVGFGRPRDIKLQTRSVHYWFSCLGSGYLCPTPSSRLPTIIQVRTLPPRHPISGKHEGGLGGGQSLFGNDPVLPRRLATPDIMYTILRLARGDHSR